MKKDYVEIILEMHKALEAVMNDDAYTRLSPATQGAVDEALEYVEG
jgi:hypothetical protein